MKRALEVLDFIKGHIRANGFPPTQAEIGDSFGWSSTNSCIKHLIKLQDAGLIEITPNVSRGIRVVGACQTCGVAKC